MAPSSESDDKYPLLLDDGTTAVAHATDAGLLVGKNFSRDTRQDQPDQPRPASKGRVNPRFLQNLVRDVEGHNSALLRREREERLSLRKHPLVDKIRAIEREKLEAGKRKRRRSCSPHSSIDRCQQHDRREFKPDTPEKVSKEPIIRGRGTRKSTILDGDDGLVTRDASRSSSLLATDRAVTNHAVHVNESEKESFSDEESPGKLPLDRAHNARREAKTMIVEDDEGKWKCGAGYL